MSVEGGTPIWYSGADKQGNAINRIIGLVKGDTFHKNVSRKHHFLQRPPAIAFDAGTLADAEDAGAEKVRVVDIDSDDVWTATMHQVRTYGIKLNRGYGPQVALPLEYWLVNDEQPTDED